MYVRMDYPCMYLCIYFYNFCTRSRSLVGKRKKKQNLWMSLEFLFFLLFETVLRYLLLLEGFLHSTRCNL